MLADVGKLRQRISAQLSEYEKSGVSDEARQRFAPLPRLVTRLRKMGEANIALIQKGIAKGNLKRPEDAKLRLGLAQLSQAKTKQAGIQTLRGVKGSDGAQDIARLWTVLA